MTKGIDISHWNNILNYDRVAADPAVNFIILKAGGSDKGFYRDPVFLRNYEAFHDDRKIPCGCYYYVGRMCIDRDSGINDAHKLLDIIAGLQFEYPVYIDLESTSPKAPITYSLKGLISLTITEAVTHMGSSTHMSNHVK